MSQTFRTISSPLSRFFSTTTTPRVPNQPSTLYQTLSRLPDNGVGRRVFQTRWQSKGIEGCYWEVTRVKLKLEGTHGKAWGKLVWRGKPVSEKEDLIRGGLKYKWSEGVSKGNNLKAVQPTSLSSPNPPPPVNVQNS